MSLVIPSYKEVSIQCDEEKGTLWVGMNPMRRQYFTLSMLIELHDLIHKLDEYGSPDPARPDIIKYFVLQSDHPDIYNAGVDLEYFPELVRKKETERLRNYGIFCIDLIYWMLTGGKRRITTIANIAGDALGGGFEAALSCNYMVVDKRATFSFPESLFGFFPGMGAYDLFKRFAGVNEADRAFTTGKCYSAEELKQMGGIYSLVEEGGGQKAVEKFIADRERIPSSHHALHCIKQRNETIQYESLVYSIDLWVDAAMNLTDKNLRMMSVVTKRQSRKRVGNRHILTTPLPREKSDEMAKPLQGEVPQSEGSIIEHLKFASQ